MKLLSLLLVLLALFSPADPAQAAVTLPESTTVIETKAFLNDISLTGELVIPEGVTEIGPQAFKGCTGLTSVTFPSTLRSIGSEAFAGCTNLKGHLRPSDDLTIAADALTGSQITILQENPASDFTYTIADGEVTITGYAGEEPIGYLVIPEKIEGYPVTEIEEYAFQFQETLTGLDLPENVKTIGANAFAFSALESVTILGDIDTATYPFDQCNSLTSVTLSENVTKIPARMLAHCYGLESITLPMSVTSIGRYAFASSGLTSLVLPDSVKTIEEYAFSTSALESVTILGDIDTATYPFSQCNNLTSVTLSESVTKIPELMFMECIGLKSIALPMSVTSIGRQSFVASGLTSLVLPDSVKTIGYCAFSQTPLKSITFPKHVDFLDYGILGGCTNLTSVTLPENITQIPMTMFSGCTALESITLPESVTYLAWGAFENTTSLTDINLDNVTSTQNSAFRGSKLVSDAAARVAAQVIKPGMTDFEKALALHDWVVSNTSYLAVFYGPEGTFFKGHGACQCYAEAYGLLLDQVGIENLYIEAAVEMNHMWNLIKLDGEWYHVDCTWDDSGDILTYEYFCLSDELIKKDHSWPYDNYPAANGTRYTNGVDHGE